MTTPTTTANELGKTTLLILGAIIYYKRRHDGCAPSVRWLRKTCKMSSVSQVDYHLNKLEQAGLIERESGQARTIRVVGGYWSMNPSYIQEHREVSSVS